MEGNTHMHRLKRWRDAEVQRDGDDRRQDKEREFGLAQWMNVICEVLLEQSSDGALYVDRQ